MPISFSSSSATLLLSSIKSAIDKDTVKTWAYDSDGDFYHKATQYDRKGFLKPTVDGSKLSLNYIPLKDLSQVPTDIKGVLYGRFLEMMINHFEASFSTETYS